MVSTSNYSGSGSPSTPTYSYEFAPGYVHSYTQYTSVSGYPYMPHNATIQEREICDDRMRAIRARNVPYVRPVQLGSLKPGAHQPHSKAKAGGIDFLTEMPLSPKPSTDIYSSSEEEDSIGPETPYFNDRFFWKDSFSDMPEQGHLNHPHPPQGRSHHPESRKYYPPTPPVIPEAELTRELASDNFSTTAASVAGKEIQQVTYQFNALVLGFKFPPNLEFIVSPNEGELPKLAHTASSKPLFEHNHKLEKLLERLDAIESNGDKEIQRMRKQVVERMLSELEGLKRMEAMALYNFNYERGVKA